ncbi:hypothetical protein LCGC14_2622140 [marine sediment metagenome]|uniref:Uncharacterized protein n=1 Tax=marine sediment metagenome TaxID=412755 RepID=A0A0F9A2W6_9ZZZZ|nr:DUF58 domain-containing protein [Porticoccus sp.]
MVERLGQFFRDRFSHWVYRRLPPSRSVSLNNRSLFIFPSKAGFGFLLLILLCWLVATNYENNVVFAITCLLVSVFVVVILHSFSNLSGLTLSFARATPAFAKEQLVVDVVLRQEQPRYRESLSLYFVGEDAVITTLGDQEETRIKVPLYAPRRGLYNPGRLTLESVYPLGLLRVWTKVDLDISCLIYPQPVFDSPKTFVANSRGEGPLQVGDGSEDFVGLNEYQTGDSLKKVAWKQYAKEQGMYTKHYADYQDERIWLDWDDYPALDREARLSRLCGGLLQVSGTDKAYGLRLPGIEILPDNNEAHRLKVLRELALFEVPNRGQAGDQKVRGQQVRGQGL